MRVKDLIDLLQTLPPECEVIGQYKDSAGSWPMGWLEAAKVPGDNNLVVVQVKVPEEVARDP